MITRLHFKMGNLRRKESCKSNDEEEEEDEETEDAEEEGDGPNPDSYFPISKSRSISRRARSRSRRGSGSQRRTCLKKFKHFTLNCSDGEATPKDLDKNTSNPVVTHTPAPTVVSPKVVVSEGEEPNVSLYDDEPAPGFIHCDLLAMIIVMLYGLALLALILDIRSYQHDSNWNGVVRSIYPFPDIPEETFFSGKFLIIYEADPGLFHAKKHLLREDRWLEVDHIIFLVVFLITTILQFTAYITRGSENQMKSTIFYFAFVGACGIVISFFPILSWNAMLVGYSFAIDHLNEFISRQIRSPGDLPTITNVTILDAINIARIMEHCREFVKPGVSSNSDPQTYTMLNRQYTSDELQKLGFCTHYEYKVASSVRNDYIMIMIRRSNS